MLSASCFFRGNFMNLSRSKLLLRNLCAIPSLRPEYWNVIEPVNIPLLRQDQDDVISALSPAHSKAIRTLVFFARKTDTRFLMSIDFRLWPFQGTTAHNSINFEEVIDGGEDVLALYLTQCVLPDSPDYASIPDWTKDAARYRELVRSYTSEEMNQLFAKKKIINPFGPYGCLGDIHWFNYFGAKYVAFIGRKRLLEAGWARVEERGDGIACYATRKIDDREAPARRAAIVRALEEFVWTPGSKPEEKRIPLFDFSEQFAAIPAKVAGRLNRAGTSTFTSFEGLSREEQNQALRALEEGLK